MITFVSASIVLLEDMTSSRMATSPNKMRIDGHEEDDKLLEEYIRMKPSRAIDRLLSQYSVDKAFFLFNMLQQKIKKNTTELRSTLTEKYQNLVDCSNLLNSIKAFTDEIEAIQKDISHVLNQDPLLEAEDSSNKKRSIISMIEQKILQKKYHLAMTMAHQHYEKIEQAETMYMPMLRIEILFNLQEEIIERKFSKAFIAEIIQCLSAFVRNLTPQQKSDIISNERSNGELLSLIAQTLETSKDTEVIVENDIIQVIFKCKLLSLHRRNKRIKQEDNISKFFHDIYQLISEKQKDSSQITHLSSIFCKNFQQIEAHLLETFIIKDNDKTISFRYELYEKLATSEDFIEILQKLYKIISESFSDAPKITLKQSFLNLWENYYNELIDLLFKRCNPINFLPPLLADKQNYPMEISKYICSDDTSIDNRIKLFQGELDFFFTNINKLIKQTYQLKSSKFNSTQIIQQIINLYAAKIDKLNKHVSEFISNISEEPSLKKLGSLIFLFIFCDQFNVKLRKYSQEKFQSLKQIKAFQIEFNYQIIKKFHHCFYDRSKKQSKWSINFDHFFMKYYNPLLKDSKKQIIKNIVLMLIEGTMVSMDQERAEAYLEEKRSKKQIQQRQLQEKRNKIADLNPNDIKPSTFAKKKIQQGIESPS